MVNQTLVEGIHRAVEKGESLQSAMMSFYSAGYPKQEIEEAAHEVQKIQHGMQAQPKVVQQPMKGKPIQRVSNYSPQKAVMQKPQQEMQKKPVQQPVQKVSNYSQPIPKKQSNGNGLIIFLAILLVLLIGGLLAVIFLREQIMGLFS